LRDNGNVDYFWWTGLVKQGGQTYIDGLQLNDPNLHGRATFNGPRSTITAADCTRFEVLKTFVFTNLPPRNDDNYYYFVDTEYLDSAKFVYLYVENEAGQLAISLLFIALISVVALFF